MAPPNRPSGTGGTEITSIAVEDLLRSARRLTVGSAVLLFGIASTIFSFAYGIGRATAANGELAAEGSGNVAPYVLPTVHSWIRFDATGEGEARRFVADQRIYYGLFAHRAPSATDDRFDEAYPLSQRAELRLLAGTEQPEALEVQHNALQWSFPLAIDTGDYKSVVTGVRRRYYEDWLSKPRFDHDKNQLANTEEDFCYPTGTDIIGEVALSVESSTLAFKAPPDGTRAFVVGPADDSAARVVVTRSNVFGDDVSVATARFKRPLVNQELCIVVAW
jgi:hypothetical protein